MMRDEELQQLQKVCHSGQNVLLIGLPGVGKTYFLKQLRDGSTEYCFCRCNCINLRQDFDLVKCLIESLPDDLRPPKDNRSLLSLATGLLNRTTSAQRFVFILDHFDFSSKLPENVAEDLQKFLCLQNEYGSNFSVIVAMRSGTLYALDADEAAFQLFHRFPLLPLSEPEVTSWLKEEQRLSSKMAQRIAELSGGLPGLIIEMLKRGKMSVRNSLILSELTSNEESILIALWNDFPEETRRWLCESFFPTPSKRRSKLDNLTYFKKIGLISKDKKDGLDIFCPLLRSYIDKECGYSLSKRLFRYVETVRRAAFFSVVVAMLYGSASMIMLTLLPILPVVNMVLSVCWVLLVLFIMLYFDVFPSSGAGLRTIQRFWILTGVLFIVFSYILFRQQSIGFLWLAICAVFSFATAVRLNLEQFVRGDSDER